MHDGAFHDDDDAWERRRRWGVYRSASSPPRMLLWAWFWLLLSVPSLYLAVRAADFVLASLGLGLLFAAVAVPLLLSPSLLGLAAGIDAIFRDRGASWVTPAALVTLAAAVSAAVVLLPRV